MNTKWQMFEILQGKIWEVNLLFWWSFVIIRKIVIHINFYVNLIDSENCPFFKEIFVVQVYKFSLVYISFLPIDTRWKPINQRCGKNLKDLNALKSQVVDDKQKVDLNLR